jgi:hypothetical protein
MISNATTHFALHCTTACSWNKGHEEAKLEKERLARLNQMVEVEVDEKAEKKKGKKDELLERKKKYVALYTLNTVYYTLYTILYYCCCFYCPKY